MSQISFYYFIILDFGNKDLKKYTDLFLFIFSFFTFFKF